MGSADVAFPDVGTCAHKDAKGENAMEQHTLNRRSFITGAAGAAAIAAAAAMPAATQAHADEATKAAYPAWLGEPPVIADDQTLAGARLEGDPQERLHCRVPAPHPQPLQPQAYRPVRRQERRDD